VEGGPPPSRSGVVDAKLVEAFLAAVAKQGKAPSQTDTGCAWKDDYPRVHVTVRMDARSAPVHMGYEHCGRQWRVNGVLLAPGAHTDRWPVQPTLNAAYQAVADAIGFTTWPTTDPL